MSAREGLVRQVGMAGSAGAEALCLYRITSKLLSIGS